jgi:predicted transglutaminase-like cysteine proteinase
VNREVNRAIRPQKNVNGVMAEEWLVSPRAGDCNDYAVTKRHKLLARGWPSRSLLLAEVVIPSGEHHLILVVRSREYDFVLDNLNSKVRPVSQVRYEWVRAQQTKNRRFWCTISVARAARVAMNAR